MEHKLPAVNRFKRLGVLLLQCLNVFSHSKPAYLSVSRSYHTGFCLCFCMVEGLGCQVRNLLGPGSRGSVFGTNWGCLAKAAA